MRFTRNSSKYNNKKTIIDNIEFASKLEAKRYSELKFLEIMGKIKKLELQPKFELQEAFKKNGITHRAISYKADFKYIDNENKIIIEDTKGFADKVFLIKQKMFEYKFKDLTLRIIKK